MAPTKPNKRTSIRAKASNTTSRPLPNNPSAIGVASTGTAPTASAVHPKKKHKLAAKHAIFLKKIESKIAKPASHQSASSRKRKAKAARQSLVTGLDSLADALPICSVNLFTSASSKAIAVDYGIGRKSMASKPGLIKRKEKIVRTECERFGKNLAIMNAGGGGSGGGTWAALRGFIEGTMEKKEEFVTAEK